MESQERRDKTKDYEIPQRSTILRNCQCIFI